MTNARRQTNNYRKAEAHDTITVIDTVWADVAVHGTHLVSPAILRVLDMCLNRPEFSAMEGDHGVRSVIFRDDNNVRGSDNSPVLGSACADNKGIAINLSRIFEVSLEACLENGSISIVALFYHNLIVTILHEIHHLEVFQKNLGIPEREMEEMAISWSTGTFFEMARVEDLEPDNWEDVPFLKFSLNGLFVDSHDWGENQLWMLKKHIFFNQEPGEEDLGLKLWTFKQYAHFRSGDHVASEKWNAELNEAIRKTQEYMERKSAKVTAGSTPAYVPEPEPTLEVEVETPTTSTVEVMQEEIDMATDADVMEAMEAFEACGEAVPTEDVNVIPPAPTVTTGSSPVNEPAFGGFPVGPPPTTEDNETAPPSPPASSDLSTAQLMQVREVMMRVYKKLYNHLFTHCQRQVGSDISFLRPEAVCEVPVTLTDEEKAVVVGYDCMDEQGKWCPNRATTDGMVRGNIKKNTKLPAYNLIIDPGNGVRIRRMIIPQNCAKQSKPAQQAREGHAIAWIINDTAKGQENGFLFKIFDGEFEALQ